MASALAQIAMPKLVNRCRDGGIAEPPAAGAPRLVAAVRLSSGSRVVLVYFIRHA
jgi:hypothetical protein